VQPVSDEFAGANGRCLADQDEESGLEGVFGILPVAQNPFADAQNHWSVPAKQGLEGRPVPAGEERLQQERVGQTVSAVEVGGSAKVPEDGVHS
jgi:hypothetical protein